MILKHKTIEDNDLSDTVEILDDFNSLLSNIIQIYDANASEANLHEAEVNDLLHYAELHDNLNACEGYKVYRKIAKARRERRRCKDENELLAAAYAFVKDNPRLIHEVSNLLGKTRGARRTIDQRIYTTRTNIVEED